MNNYNVYLSISNIEADSEKDVKKKFWELIEKDKNLLSLEVEELNKNEVKNSETKPLNVQEVKERVLPFIARHCNSDGEINASLLEKNFTNEEINLMFETGHIYEPVKGTVKTT